MKILIAADGSAHTKRMLAYLAAHDELLGTRHEYTVLTVVPEMPARIAAYVAADVLRNYHQEVADGVLNPIRAFFEQQGIQATFVHTVAHAADSIASVAREGGFDLVVIGSHGHGALANLVLGSVTTGVLAKCATPVLIVR